MSCNTVLGRTAVGYTFKNNLDPD